MNIFPESAELTKLGEEALRAALKMQTHEGVYWNGPGNSWKACVKKNGKKLWKSFSVRKYGADESLRLAIETRREMQASFRN